MLKRDGFTLIELMIVVVVIGLLAAMAIPNYMNMQNHAKEASTKSNAHTLQLAVEDYSVRNGGLYSVAPADLTPLLPRQNLMSNSFTGMMSEPRFGAVAGATGEIGIVALIAGGVTTGYSISAWGKDNAVLTIEAGSN
ncbi:MAG: prepilin-type N-terminal cleavage/methylation domain-containing protein [Candidatus Krumholzibacteriia bacterium]|jgi:prepilin-type N-terminal cleavage/methylation domain-containing protein